MLLLIVQFSLNLVGTVAVTPDTQDRMASNQNQYRSCHFDESMSLIYLPFCCCRPGPIDPALTSGPAGYGRKQPVSQF